MNRVRVQTHFEVEGGDILIHVEVAGTVPITYKLTTTNWFGEMAELFQYHFTNQEKTVIRLVKYESPIREKLLKEVTIN